MSARWTVLAALVLAGCVNRLSSGRTFEPRHFHDDGWAATPGVRPQTQVRELDCGPVAAAIVLEYWGRPASPDALRAEAGVPPEHGLQAGALRDLVKARGLQAFLVEGEVEDLERELLAGRPVLVGMAKPFSAKQALGHYEVVAGFHRARSRVVTVDPATGWREYSLDDFLREWGPTKKLTLIVSGP